MNEPNRTTVVLFGSLGVAVDCLRWLLEQPNLHVMGVVCSREPRKPWRRAVHDEDMQEAAPKLGIPLMTMDDVLTVRADIGLSVRFHEILRAGHLERFRLGVVNLHGAPLPEMRGSMCDAAAIIENRPEYGTSLHWMDTGIDSGDLLAEYRFPIRPGDTVYDLFRQSNEHGLRLIRQCFPAIVSGRLAGTPQQRIAAQKGIEPRTYTAREVLKYKNIPPGLSESARHRIIRAFQFPGHIPAYTETDNGITHYRLQAETTAMQTGNEGLA